MKILANRGAAIGIDDDNGLACAIRRSGNVVGLANQVGRIACQTEVRYALRRRERKSTGCNTGEGKPVWGIGVVVEALGVKADRAETSCQSEGKKQPPEGQWGTHEYSPEMG